MEQSNRDHFDDEQAATFTNVKGNDAFMFHIREVNAFTMKKYIGDAEGRTLLDLGCGNGDFCRFSVTQWGVSKAVGVDISESFIRLAREKSKGMANIEYRMGDCLHLPQIGQFDVALSNYVLMYAQSYKELTQYVRGAFINLKPGGIFCGVVSTYHPDVPTTGEIKQKLDTSDSDIMTWELSSIEEFSPLKFTIKSDQGELTMIDHRMYPGTPEKALQDVGFIEVRGIPLEMSEEGQKKLGRPYVPPSIHLQPHSYIFYGVKPEN